MNASVRNSNSLEQLCIALAHWWDPERIFVILTSYFDESGTHGGSPVTMMAGYVADARQWRSYEKRISKLFRRFKVDVFHAIDLHRSDDCFDEWTVDKKTEFLDEFTHIINETVEIGFSSILSEEDYRWYLSLERTKRARKESKYAIFV